MKTNSLILFLEWWGLRSRSRTDLPEERPVELDDVDTVTAPHHHVQVHQQLFLFLLVHRGADPLQEQQSNNG